MTVVHSRDDFLSGTSGVVSGVRAMTRAVVADAVCDLAAVATAMPWRLSRAAARWPRRRVLALAIERPDVPNVLPEARRELLRSHHDVTIATKTTGGLGKFENLNVLLEDHAPSEQDWILIVDDDVLLPHGFLDAFVFLAERYELSLAQPAHRWRSHAAWWVTRRQPGAIVRETRFVEIGPVCGLHRRTFGELLPFPPLRFGWGLELHWSAIAREQGWREGVLDAIPVQHGLRKIASSYAHQDAVAEARAFLADHPYTTAGEAQRPLAVHRGW